MKKLYALSLTIALAAGVNAQGLQKPSERFRVSKEELNSLKHHQGVGPVNRAQSFYMDHSVANYDDGGFIWRINSLYTSVDTALNFAGLALSNCAGFTDPADVAATVVDSSFFGFTSAYPTNIGIRIDTIYAQITHENNSGNYDYMTMQIVKLTTGGAPATAAGVATVLWEQKDSTNVTLSGGGNWVGTGAGLVITYTPQPTFMGASPGTKLGLIYKYEDASKLDTASLYAGYVIDPLDPTNALQSTIKTSFMRYPPNIPNVTRTTNVGYGSPVGSAGWFEAQNWGMWAHVSVGTDVSGFGENPANGFRVIESYPNPTNEVTNIRYELGVPSDVAIVVTDIVGNVVSKTANTQQTAGEYTVSLDTDNLANGIYTYTLNANKASISKRFIVQH
jgi:hypothetical protein